MKREGGGGIVSGNGRTASGAVRPMAATSLQDRKAKAVSQRPRRQWNTQSKRSTFVARKQWKDKANAVP